jgi:hypothetical protein
VHCCQGDAKSGKASTVSAQFYPRSTGCEAARSHIKASACLVKVSLAKVKLGKARFAEKPDLVRDMLITRPAQSIYALVRTRACSWPKKSIDFFGQEHALPFEFEAIPLHST